MNTTTQVNTNYNAQVEVAKSPVDEGMYLSRTTWLLIGNITLIAFVVVTLLAIRLRRYRQQQD